MVFTIYWTIICMNLCNSIIIKNPRSVTKSHTLFFITQGRQIAFATNRIATPQNTFTFSITKYPMMSSVLPITRRMLIVDFISLVLSLPISHYQTSSGGQTKHPSFQTTFLENFHSQSHLLQLLVPKTICDE